MNRRYPLYATPEGYLLVKHPNGKVHWLIQDDVVLPAKGMVDHSEDPDLVDLHMNLYDLLLEAERSHVDAWLRKRR